MKKTTFLLFILSYLHSFSIAQTGLSWQKTYGGSNHEYTCKTIPTADGGYAFVGFSESNDGDVSGNHGGVDLWVGKLNATGIVQWSFLYGGTADDEGYDLLQTDDGGYMVAGWTDSFDGDVTGHHGTSSSDFWVLKLSSTGALTWQKCYGGLNDDEAAALVRTQDGNYYVAGSTYSSDGDVSGLHGNSSDFWVIKISSAGTLLNQKCLGGTNNDEGITMSLTADTGCIVGGRSSSADGDATGYHGGADMMIVKLRSGFAIDWAKCFGGTETEECNSIVQLTGGNFVALGYTSTGNNGDVTGHHGSQGSDDFWLVKINANGTLDWAKCYGGTGDDQANGLTAANDGGFVMCGLTNSTNGDVSGFHTGGFFDPDVWVAKVNSTGTFLWQRCCGGSGQDESFNVFEIANGTYVVTGFTYSNDFDVTLNRGSADGWILNIFGSSSYIPFTADDLIEIYPNPTTNNIYFKSPKPLQINVYNIYGKLIQNSITIYNDHLTLPGRGIYLIELFDGTETFYKKIIVQ